MGTKSTCSNKDSKGTVGDREVKRRRLPSAGDQELIPSKGKAP